MVTIATNYSEARVIESHRNMAADPHSTINAVNKTGSNNGYTGKPITETLTNGFFTVDHKWTVKYWNKAAEKLLGVRAKDVVGTNLWEKFAEIIPLEFYTVYQKAFLQGTPLHFEEYLGEIGAWFDVTTYHCDDTLSVSFKSCNQLHDEYPENTLQRLNALTELYRFVTEITNDCLWDWDLRAREIFWIDGGHKRIFGYQIENALIPQVFWESRLHPEDRKRMLMSLDKAIARGSGNIWEEEYRFQKADGDYAYVHDRGHIIYNNDQVASRIIGATQDITKRVLLENKLAGERQAKQREITGAVLTAQENERVEIGKELHDNLNQILAVAKMYLQMAKGNEKDKAEYLDRSYACINDVISEIRRISKSLVLPGINIIGLFDNIRNLADDLMKIHPVKIEFEVIDLDENKMDEKLQLNLFRMVQEQLTNIIKHAKAKRAFIQLKKVEDQVILSISDNGAGCDMDKEINGVGIINIRSRAGLYHGTVTTISALGEGYKLNVVLEYPLKGTPGDKFSSNKS